MSRLGRVPPPPSPEESEAVKLNKEAGEHFNEGRYEKATQLWKQAIERLGTAGKAEDTVIIAPLNNLACALGEMGDMKGKILYLRRALEVIEKQYGTDHPQFAVAMSNLATTIGDSGDPKTMLELLDGVRRQQEKFYKRADHPKVARTRLAMADAYGRLRLFEEQIDMLEATLPMIKAHTGEFHPQVGITLNNLASAYGNKGDQYKARDLLEEALDIERKTLGPFHPQLAITKVNLADVQGRIGKPDVQRKLLEDALAIQTRHFGAGHKSMIVPTGNLAAVLSELGDHVEARIQAEKAHQLAVDFLKPTDRTLAMCKTNLAVALAPFTKQKENAIELLHEAIALLEKIPGTDKVDDAEIVRARFLLRQLTGEAGESAPTEVKRGGKGQQPPTSDGGDA